MTFLPSGIRLGPYKIEALIGAGGMGEVYRAIDTRLNRDVAIKILCSDLTAEPGAMQRFEREVHAASALNDPHICTIYDVGEHNGGRFLVMELLAGRTLNQYMDGQPLALNQVLDLGMQIATALRTAHGKGIIHRDIKPANIFVMDGCKAKVLDFGLARFLPPPNDRDATQSLTLTEPQTVLGTFPYMAPEQLRGEKTDVRTDIWGFGALLYEMATGQRPFRENMSTLLTDAILHRPPPCPRTLNGGIPAELERIILKCLDKDPESRYQSATDLVVDLRRLTAPTSQSDGTSSAANLRDWQLTVRRLALAGTGVLGLVAVLIATNAGGWRERLLSRAASPRIQSLAVLPLANLSHDPEQDYFADGMTLDLITTLTKISNLKVISWTSVRGYKNTTKTLPEIARELNADAIVDGSIERSGNRVKITFQLIHASSDRNLWAEGYDRELRDILSLQDEVASQVARQVRVALTPQDRARLSAARPVDPEAYLFYVRGRADMQRWTRNTWETARQNFRQAIEKDPAYALAYAGLAESYVTGDDSLDPKVSIPLARAAAAKALALDDTVSDAHVATAQIRSLEDWDWSGGEAEFKRAIELNPGDTLAHHLYSHLLLVLGRFEESLRESKLYVELDPVSAAAYDHLGFHYVMDGQNDLAILALQKAAQLDPSWEGGYRDLGNAYRRKSMAKEALHQYEQAMRVDGVEPQSIEALRRAFSSGGWSEYWRESLNQQLRNSQHRYVDPYGIAVLYALLGDKENAFRYLDLAYSSHDDSLAYIRADYDLSSLHTDPRYSALLQRMRLPQ